MHATTDDHTSRPDRLNWIRTGPPDAETIILIHPVGYDLTHWDAQIDALRGRYDVIAFDLPGHGLSAGGPAQCTFDAMVETVRTLIGTAGRHAAHIVGISVGGMIAQSFAVAHPDAALSLTLIATASTFSEPVRQGMRQRARTVREGGMQTILEPTLQRWFTPTTMAERPHVTDRVSKILLAGSPSVHAAMWEMIASFGVHERLSEITCPTLILVGDLDPSTPPAAARTMGAAISNAHLVVIPEASHMVAIECPQAVNREILSFLEGCGPKD